MKNKEYLSIIDLNSINYFLKFDNSHKKKHTHNWCKYTIENIVNKSFKIKMKYLKKLFERNIFNSAYNYQGFSLLEVTDNNKFEF